MPARAEKLAKESDRNPIKDSEEANQRCQELDAELAELRAAYELYFQGVERFPPTKKHDAFKRDFAKLKGTFVRQTAAKFRIDGIGQKLMTYERLWERNLKDIENGTSKREIARARRHREEQEKKKKASGEDDFHIDEDLDLSDLDEGDGDLAAAVRAAEAAVTAKPAPATAPVKPVTPAIAPVTPAGGVKQGTGIAPSIMPVTPPGGLKPATGVQAAFNPLAPPTAGGKPMITAPLTGANPALKPAGATGSNPALKPAGATGSNPALKPAGATGSNPALRPAGSAPVGRPSTGPDGGLSDTKIKAIYDAYVMAKKRCGEDTRSVTYDSVASSLKKQVPELMKSHNAKSVEFKVVIKDGKAVLRALPKEE